DGRFEEDAQFGVIFRSGRIEEEAVFLADAEAELEIEPDLDLNATVDFEAEPRHTDVEGDGGVDQRRDFAEAHAHEQTGVAVDGHGQLAVAEGWIEFGAGVYVDQEVQSIGAERGPERLLDGIFQRGQSVA